METEVRMLRDYNRSLLFGGLLLAAAFPCRTLAQATESAVTPSVLSMEAAVNRGQADDVLQQIAALRAAGTKLPGIDRVEGEAFYSLGNMKSADKSFAAAISADPKDTNAAGMRGLALVKLGRPADAIPLLEQASAAFSEKSSSVGKADPRYALALCYIDTRRYDDARHAFAAQYRFAPDSAEAYLLAARMLLRREYLPVSQSFAEKSIQLSPALPLAHELLGEIALAQGRLDDAIVAFEFERQHNPLEPSVYDRLGDAYVRAARYDDAQLILQQAVVLEPNSTGPFILLGKTLLKKNDAVGAAMYLEHAASMDNANYMTHSLLGQTYRIMGRPADAKRETDLAQRLQTASEPKIESVR